MTNWNNFFPDGCITKIDDFSSHPWLRERLKDDDMCPIGCMEGGEIHRNSSGSGRSNVEVKVWIARTTIGMILST